MSLCRVTRRDAHEILKCPARAPLWPIGGPLDRLLGDPGIG
jgi:hypothetical protein